MKICIEYLQIILSGIALWNITLITMSKYIVVDMQKNLKFVDLTLSYQIYQSRAKV